MVTDLLITKQTTSLSNGSLCFQIPYNQVSINTFLNIVLSSLFNKELVKLNISIIIITNYYYYYYYYAQDCTRLLPVLQPVAD